MKNLLFAMLLGFLSSSYGFDVPYPVGEGRILNSDEEKAFFNRVESTGKKEKLEYFHAIYEREKSQLKSGSKASLAGIKIIKFSEIYKIASALKDGAQVGDEIFLICFDCRENIPLKVREAGLNESGEREFWVLAGTSISLGINVDGWRILYYGASE